MKVKDYYSDMVLNQKWAVEVKTVCCHNSVDEPFDDVAVSTYHYSVPFVGRCNYLDYDVQYFRIVNDTIYLYVNDYDEV